MFKTDYNKRVRLLEGAIRNFKLDSFLVTNETNVSYVSGFRGHDSILLIVPGEKFFITDSRYVEQAREELEGFEVKLVASSTYTTIEELVGKLRLKRVGFESMNLPYEVATRLKDLLGKAELLPAKNIVENVRAIKDRGEVEKIRDSISLTKNVLDKIMSLIRPGLSEQYLSRTVELEFIKQGARPGFEPIVAAGANSSKPHAIPTDAKIADDSFVMIDIGCNLNGYNSDLTRMALLGKAKDKFKKIYNIVRTAKELAIEKIRPGVKISEIDIAARRYIQKNGFGKYFGHSLGHGVGMEVHEQPTISKVSKGILSPGMVFTIEPAIYIPKFGGVRIEDMVLVTDKGSEVLSR